jgi:hypothetical protein
MHQKLREGLCVLIGCCMGFAIRPALILGPNAVATQEQSGNAGISSQTSDAAKSPQKSRNSALGKPPLNQPSLNQETSTLLGAVLRDKSLSSLIKFVPFGQSFNVATDQFALAGLKDYVPRLEEIMKTYRAQAKAYESEKLDYIGKFGSTDVYYIPAEPNANLQKQFAMALEALFPDRQISDFIYKSALSTLGPVTGDFQSKDRVFTLLREPDGNFAIRLCSLDQAMEPSKLKSQFAAAGPESAFFALPSNRRRGDRFSEVPEYLSHLVDQGK